MFNKILSSRQQGTIYAISSGLCYGLVGYFGISLINFNLSVPNMLFWRFLIATIIPIIVILPKHRRLLKIQKSDLKMLLYGIIFFGISSITFFISAKHVGTGVATAMSFTYPVFVILSGVLFYKTKLTNIYYLVLLMLIAGIICTVGANKFTFEIFGTGFGMASSFCYACYILASKKSTSTPIISTLMTTTGCAIACLIAACIDSSFYVPSGLNVWINILATAIICTVMPILLFLQALEHTDAEKASVLSVSQLVFVAIFGVILLNESLTSVQIIGIMVIILGTFLTLVHDKQTEKPLVQDQ